MLITRLVSSAPKSQLQSILNDRSVLAWTTEGRLFISKAYCNNVEAYSLFSIRNMAWEEFSFPANDWGTDKTILKNCPAPSNLVIKKGTPVVLVRNLFHISLSLVSGLSGTIVDITSVGPIVCFDNGFVLCIKATDFPMFNSHGILLATRKQLPPQLAFASHCA